MSQPRHAVGIDFGTSTSLVAEGRPGRRVVNARLGETTSYMPTLVGWTGTDLAVGERAADLGEGRFVRSIKRAITENKSEVELADGSTLDVNEGVEAVLRELGRRSRDYVELSPETIRLGCPAMWTADQRTRLLDLAVSAGLPVADHTLIDEPVAAGVAWVRERVERHGEYVDGKLLVFDMGGGTLDIAVLQVEGGPGQQPAISVLSSMGTAQAGDNLDDSLRDRVLHGLQVDLTHDDFNTRLLRGAALSEARIAKLILSESWSAPIQVRDSSGRAFEYLLERGELEDVFGPQLRAARNLTLSAIRMSRLVHVDFNNVGEIMAMPDEQHLKEIDYVLLAGGMSRVPVVREEIQRMFDHAQVFTDAGVPADEVICAGLADPESYERINLNRPAFDLSIESGTTSYPLYRAYTPLYESWLTAQRHVVYFEAELPAGVGGHFVVRTPSGEQIRLRSGDVVGESIPVEAGYRPLRLVVYPHGLVILTDGKGRQNKFRVPKWPAIRASNHAELLLEGVEGSSLPIPVGIDKNYRFNDGQ